MTRDLINKRLDEILYTHQERATFDTARTTIPCYGGWLPAGVASGRKLIMELQCNMALRWFVGLELEEKPWDVSTFGQNRRRRFDRPGVLERLFDQTVQRAIKENLISPHVSADGTLVRANASFKSFVPIEVAMDPLPPRGHEAFRLEAVPRSPFKSRFAQSSATPRRYS